MSNRGVALDKDGTDFVPGHVVYNIRPISIEDAARCIAAKCQTLQFDPGVEEREAGQYGAGSKNGTDSVYHKLSETMDSFVAACCIRNATW